MEETFAQIIGGIAIYVSLFTVIPAIVFMLIQIAIYHYDERGGKHEQNGRPH